LFPLQSDELHVEPVAMPFREGEVVAGKYEVLKLLGSGGMGYVVAARHLELDEKVALKFLRPECLTNRELVARFAREARAAVKIKSEYVARVFDVGTMPRDGAPFIVMEHLEGKDLCDIVGEQGPLPIKNTAEHIMQACEALASAHAIGIVHRDIKPENLFLTKRSHAVDIIKVLDFGISKVALTGSAADDRTSLVKTSAPVGSPLYMSPEQLRGSDDVDTRTDIWSLGCVLFELLTGHLPFEAPSITMVTAAILEQAPPKVRSLRADVPAALEAVVSRCLEKDPNRRFQDVGELAAALYPFAPRRARLSAESCRQILRGAGLSQATAEIASQPPPSGRNPNTTMTLPSTAKVPSRAKLHAGPLAEFLASPLRRNVAVAAAGALLVAGALALRPSPPAVPATPRTEAKPESTSESPSIPTAIPAVTASAASPAVPAIEAPPSPIPSSTGSSSKSKAEPPRAKPGSPSPAQSAGTPTQDLDVGF
jgi:serine/threonine-protein kinase